MGRSATKHPRSPLPATRKVKPRQPTVTEDHHTAAAQQPTPLLLAATKIEVKQPTITENDVRVRAYELYLEQGAIPGDEVRDWLQAERELLAD